MGMPAYRYVSELKEECLMLVEAIVLLSSGMQASLTDAQQGRCTVSDSKSFFESSSSNISCINIEFARLRDIVDGVMSEGKRARN